MLLENIAIGKSLDIYVERDEYRYRLVSKVEETSPRRVCVSLIASHGRAFMFKDTDHVRLVYRDDEQMWEWNDVMAGIAKLDGDPVHVFQIRDKGRSFNRRNAFRVSIAEQTEVGYYFLAEKGMCFADAPIEEPMTEEEVEEAIFNPPPEPKLQKAVAMVKDLSETGVGIYSDYAFHINDSFNIDINSPYGKLHAKATVVRVVELRSASNKFNYYYGCAFSESDKKIIKYIYDLQREMLRKQRG